jgi:hypothetical protein
MYRSIRLAPVALSAFAFFAPYASPVTAQTPPSTPSASRPDGQHDFDFEIGKWNIHLRKLLHPLTGSTEWVEFDGTSVTRPVWDGRANLEEFETDGTSGHVEGMTLRLYDPLGKQWSLFWANSRDGNLAIPTIGSFKDGRGEFYDFERIQDRFVWVRYQWSQITANSAHFEQAFSEDGGRNWEVNWVTDQRRAE